MRDASTLKTSFLQAPIQAMNTQQISTVPLDKPSNVPLLYEYTPRSCAPSLTGRKDFDAQQPHSRNVSVLLLSELR
jgi:hypothetical protein